MGFYIIAVSLDKVQDQVLVSFQSVFSFSFQSRSKLVYTDTFTTWTSVWTQEAAHGVFQWDAIARALL